MHLGSQLANGMRPPTVAHQDILGVNASTSIRALSGIVEPPSQRCATPCLYRSKHGYIFDQPRSIHPVTSSPQSVHTRAEHLSASETQNIHRYHIGGVSPPIVFVQSNTREILLQVSNQALDAGPRPQHSPSELHPSDPQTPRVYPI